MAVAFETSFQRRRDGCGDVMDADLDEMKGRCRCKLINSAADRADGGRSMRFEKEGGRIRG